MFTDGKCVELELPNELFVHDPENPAHPLYVNIAKKACAACPFQKQCLEYGEETGSVGVWGGQWLDLPPEETAEKK